MIKEKGGGLGEFGTMRRYDDDLPQPLSPTHTGRHSARREFANGPSGNVDIGVVSPASPSQLERGTGSDTTSRSGGWLSSYFHDDDDYTGPQGLAGVLFHILWFPFYVTGLCLLLNAAVLEIVGGALKGLGKLLTRPGMFLGSKGKKSGKGKQAVSI
jgi:hypothetical protein